MGALQSTKVWPVLGAAAVTVLAVGCRDTGFGKPCHLPQSESFRAACDPAPQGGDSNIHEESKASCAVNKFAGCETRTCLVYRGSSAFCSEACTEDGDCDSDLCAPLIGERPASSEELKQTCLNTDCYCIRKADLGR
jgi:hypothetical protein